MFYDIKENILQHRPFLKVHYNQVTYHFVKLTFMQNYLETHYKKNRDCKMTMMKMPGLSIFIIGIGKN